MRKNPETKELSGYYRLVESYRNHNGNVCVRTTVCEVTGFEKEKITKDRLYAISTKLYAEKDALEQFLSIRTNELFDIEDRIMLYDLTNTYFEGRKTGSKLAKFGRSKEKRTDAKLVVLALVINPEGFITKKTKAQWHICTWACWHIG